MANFSANSEAHALPTRFVPLNIRHCLRLAFWIYFQPSRLKCHLYQLDPEFYCAAPGLAIFKTFFIPDYRHLYLSAINASLLLSSTLSLIGLPILLATAALNIFNFDGVFGLLYWLIGILAGNAVGSLFFLLFFGMFGIVVSVARGIVTGLSVGIATGVALSTLLSLGLLGAGTLDFNIEAAFFVSGGGLAAFSLLGLLSRTLSKTSIAIWIVVSIATGLISGLILDPSIQALRTNSPDNIVTLVLSFGLVIGVLVSIAIGGANGLVVGGIVGVACTLIAGTFLGMVSEFMTGSSLNTNAFQVANLLLGLTCGLAAMGVSGAALSLAQGIIDGAFIGVALGIAVGIQSDWKYGLMTMLAATLLALRIPFHIVEFILALRSLLQGKRHPCEWDEVFTLPLPGTQKRLVQCLRQDEQKGLQVLSNLVCNPFQRWAAQSGFKACLDQHYAPIHMLYGLLISKVGQSYIFAPVTPEGWASLPTINQVMLSELSGQWVDCNIDATSRFFERGIYVMTLGWRDRKSTPLSDFAGLLFQLLDRRIVETSTSSLTILSASRPILIALVPYLGGIEIKQSFELMEKFLSCRRISDVAEAVKFGDEFASPREAIRPFVLTVLSTLITIGADISSYTTAVSRLNKQNSLLRSTDALDSLGSDINAESTFPEQIVLKQIVFQWRHLVVEAGGRLGRSTSIEPLINPYVAGNPVERTNFVGREDIMLRLEELWHRPAQAPSIVLYGHRRMGKTSILRNLQTHLDNFSTVVNFNLQLFGNVKSTNELLYALAVELYDSLSVEIRQKLLEPDADHFLTGNPYQLLIRFLKQLNYVRENHRFIIAIDEFELLEALISSGTIDPVLIHFWRGLIQTYPWIIMIFAGLHTLNEMQQDYWSPFFSSVTSIPVGFLSTQAAHKLITQPSHDFDIEYDSEVVQRMIELTNGQPYLLQLMGRALVSQYNRQVYEEARPREKRFTVDDLDSVLESPAFYREGDAYFSGVWSQVIASEPSGQSTVLVELCNHNLSENQLLEGTSFNCQELQSILEVLQRHDVLKRVGSYYTYQVELMRRWVKKTQLLRER
jgi:hypothetical protein